MPPSSTFLYGVRSGTKSILGFRGLGNTSSLRKLFFESLSVVFVASVPCLRVVASFVSSYCFLRGTAGFSSWRRYGLMSSLRPSYVFVSSGLLSDFTCILKLYLPSFAWFFVALLLCYLVTLLSCYHVTLLPCNLVTLLPCYYVTLLLCNSVTLLLLYRLYLHKLYLTALPCYYVTL